MPDKYYLVTMDGHLRSCGSDIYVVGLFDNIDDANALASRIKAKGAYPVITPLTLGQSLQIYIDSNGDHIGTDAYLGGYEE